jgi:hypothetical protein
MRTEQFDTDLCPDCITMSQYGWDEQWMGRPVPDPCPLALLVADGINVLVGVPDEDPHFSNSPCPGCGAKAGDRSHVTIVHILKEGE